MIALLALAAALLPSALAAAPPPLPPPPGQVIAAVSADFDRDGQTETLQVVMVSGRRWQDQETWCGQGDKWSGQFVLRLWRGGRLLDQQPFANLFWPPEQRGQETFFWAPRFELVLADYNQDGRLDFNLGQYGTCNGNIYRLFTVTPAGRLAALPVQDRWFLFVSPPSRDNSTQAIRAAGGVLSHTFYDNTQGRSITSRYHWDGARFVLLPAKASP